MARFEGTSSSSRPPTRAKKVSGVKYYELARRGEEVPHEPKEVTVYELRAARRARRTTARIALPPLLLLGHLRPRAWPTTWAQALGCGAHLAAPAPHRRSAASTVEQRADRSPRWRRGVEAGERPGAAWVPFDQIPLPFGEVTADPQQEQRIRHGQTVLVRELGGEEGDWVKLLNRRREFIAVGTVVERIGSRRRRHRAAARSCSAKD